MDVGESCSTQLIDAEGSFNASGLERFLGSVKLAECGLSYAVVSIMGPQSSGKSTLLNHLFRTNFREMDAFKGRSQTTKGIWIAKAVGIEPCTIVMDLEGTDGRERGEDDTTFEKQSALFALAISDIVLINMWCHDIGREQAANKPLLKTVFQAMMRLFSPRKTTLLFVIRDKTKTPLEHLEPVLREDIQKIWDMVPKPQSHKETALREFFNVEVTALSSYEEKEEQFKEQVAQLRQRFFHCTSPGGLAGDRHGVVPASAFSFSAQQIWKVIRENKDLHLPAHKVMVATVRCEEIANEKLSRLASDEDWLKLEEEVQSGLVSGFGKKLSSILDSYMSEYDMETVYFDEGVRSVKRQLLESKALHLVHPAHQTMLGHLRSKTVQKFKSSLEQKFKKGEGFAASVRSCTRSCLSEFDKGCTEIAVRQASWDPSKIREKLRRDIEAHAASIRSAELSEIVSDYEKQLTETLGEPVESIFDSAGNDIWASIRKLYKRETKRAVSGFSIAISGFELDQETSNKMINNLIDFARSVVEKKARDESGKVLMHMKDRFSTVFSHENDSMPRVWTGRENIRAITKDARAAALKVLSALAAIRLDGKPDKIEHVLSSSLMDGPAAQERIMQASTDPLASSTWEEVSPRNTLITPVQCKSLWRQFEQETNYTVRQAISAQEAQRRIRLPAWVFLAMAVLGYNEFMLILRNPFYPMVFLVVFLLCRALWVQLDIAQEFRNGPISGILSVSSRFLPTVMNILKRLANEGEKHGTPTGHQPSRRSSSFRSQSLEPEAITNSVPDASSSTHVLSSESGIEDLS
ncbi:hypothetical protein QJS04_geneDACA014575 [Acorus gramineus]|uniref:Protein ROOT HAIR DEFECTIVE 3 homolog n=1 Tax=Acorus gramineus TaxID=55184 RepID=A0AAV9ASQ8_ACOGR|nr:hypothetical protein QJS04_geneDACA014575 [Acorus gramineus]